MNATQIKQLNTIVWDNNSDKVKRPIIEKGGMNIRNIESHINMININSMKVTQ